MSASTERKNRQEARAAGTDKKTQMAAEEAKRAAKSKRRWTLGTIAVVLLIVAAILLNSGILYSATPAVKINGVSYSPAQVGYYYGNAYNSFLTQYGSYATYFGLDTSSGITGLASQNMGDDTTWKDYFMDQAVSQMKSIQALCDYADQNGIEASQEDVDSINSELEAMTASVTSYGYKNLNAFFKYNYGKGVTEKVYRQEALRSAKASAAYDAYVSSLSFSEDEAAAYYATLNGDYDIYTYALYSLSAEDTDGDGSVSEEEYAAAEANAQKILDAYNADTDTADITERLTAAVQTVVADATASSTHTAGSSLNSYYADFLKGIPAEGEAAYFGNTTSNYFVVANIAHDDNSYQLGQVRHILVKAEADENGEYSSDALATARLKAEEILAQWESGEKTEDSFAALADELSDDSSEGGLYATVDKYSYVPEFTEFALGDHNYGDTAIVFGESSSYAGYHVMFYIGKGAVYSNYIADTLLKNDATDSWFNALTETYTSETTGWLRYAG